jgi:membrane protease YdiL (CAAX protease family)
MKFPPLAWLAEIRKFLNEEKLYAYCLFLILAVYGILLTFGPPEGEEPPSEAMARIKQVEEKIGKEKSEQDLIAEILKKNPLAAAGLSLFFLLFIAGLGGGLFLDGVVISRWIARQPVVRMIRPPTDSAWGVRDLVKAVILFFIFGLATSFLIGMANKFLFKDWQDNFLVLLHTTLNDLIMVAIILYFVLRKYGGRLSDIGLFFGGGWKDVSLGALGYVATLPVFFAVLLALLGLAALFSYEPPPHPLVEVFVEEDKRNPLLIGYSIFLACVIGPVIEEIFFRGFCYPAVRRLWGARAGIFLTAGLFAWIHHSTFAFWPIFILGVILAYLYEKRQSLVPSITLHVIHNSVFIGYFFLMKRIFLDKFL